MRKITLSPGYGWGKVLSGFAGFLEKPEPNSFRSCSADKRKEEHSEESRSRLSNQRDVARSIIKGKTSERQTSAPCTSHVEIGSGRNLEGLMWCPNLCLVVNHLSRKFPDRIVRLSTQHPQQSSQKGAVMAVVRGASRPFPLT